MAVRKAKGIKEVDGGLLSSPEKQQVYIGIDQSLTGFAVTAYSPASGKYHSWVYASPYRGVRRLLDIQEFLDARIKEVKASKHVVQDFSMEGGVFSSQNAAPLGELAAAVKLYLATTWKARPLIVPVTMAKKYATGRGNARKNEVMLGIYKHFGEEFADDNMADSYVIAKVCAAVNGKESKTLVYQKAVAEAINASPEKFRDS